MCGLVGYVNYKKDISKEKDIIIGMNKTITQRGPDELGYYSGTNIMLGHRRLIVRDPEGGKQPMIAKYSFGEYVIVYNGQIYNTDELKKKLDEKNVLLNSYSDTEILLKSFITFGKDIVKDLNGIFAFAIWDSKKEELFICRDHFGVKPFFFTLEHSLL